MYGLYGLKHHIVEISGDVTDAGRDERTTSKDRATQLLICEPLSFAIKIRNINQRVNTGRQPNGLHMPSKHDQDVRRGFSKL